jgi:hypothetical protein
MLVIKQKDYFHKTINEKMGVLSPEINLFPYLFKFL